MADVLNRLNQELGIGGAKNKMRLPAVLEAKGYKALRIIGEGAYGKALLVSTDGSTPATSQQNNRHSDLPHPNAPSEAKPIPSLIIVKHINMAQYTRQERLASKNEIGFLKKLNHPHIIRYIDSLEEGDNLYILMEYADCGDLEAKVKKGRRLDEKEILTLFVQTVEAVGYMHGLKVLHRDIKPQNVFMSNGGTSVKIGDFGISKSLNHTKAMAHTVCGTPYYFSPELCKGKPYNAASDIWALGVMLYEMLTRKMPFDARTMTQLMAAICGGNVNRRPELMGNEQLWSLITSMLSKDPLKRPDCGAILLHPALRGLASAETSNANGIHMLPIPPHMAHARKPSCEFAPLPLGVNPSSATPTPSHTPPTSARHRGGDGSPSPSPPPGPNPHAPSKAPLPTPYGIGAGNANANNANNNGYRAIPSKQQQLYHQQLQQQQQNGGQQPYSALAGGQRRESNPCHNNGAVAAHLPNVAGAMKPNHFMASPANNNNHNNNHRNNNNAHLPNVYENNTSPNEQNNVNGDGPNDNGSGNGALRHQQEAALLRAKLAAKNEAYNYHRAREVGARPF